MGTHVIPCGKKACRDVSWEDAAKVVCGSEANIKASSEKLKRSFPEKMQKFPAAADDRDYPRYQHYRTGFILLTVSNESAICETKKELPPLPLPIIIDTRTRDAGIPRPDAGRTPDSNLSDSRKTIIKIKRPTPSSDKLQAQANQIVGKLRTYKNQKLDKIADSLETAISKKDLDLKEIQRLINQATEAIKEVESENE